MQPLEKNLRSKLERTVKEARDIAEIGAKSALKQLGIGEAKPFDYLSEEERILRRRLRAHGRQLGDKRDPKTDIQEIDLLIEEVAYEHWHRMLFARFLAENNLLMYPDPVDPVAVSLEECEDLAADEGAKNGWELAARFATRMLPQIFRVDSPVFALELPPEHQQNLEALITGIDQEAFEASDSLGWVYQFWQSKRKDEVNASGVKIGSKELPSVTQLFTEPYMVSFLLDNSLGAWWAGKRLSLEDLKSASSEEELRKKASIPGVPLEYLRFVQTDDKVWTPAAGIFENWPENLSEFKALDPCCGSGHFLVATFLMLVPIRMELEQLSAKEAVDVVLKENINGLEIDQRCVELAAFALAISAWRYPNSSGFRSLPDMNIACSGLSVSLPEKEWIELAGEDQNLKIAMQWLHEDFQNAPILGSLINPLKDSSQQMLGNWDQVVGKIKGKQWQTDVELEAGVVAHGMVKSVNLLSGEYHLVITNVPYLGRGGQSRALRNYIDRFYSEGSSDLATAFLLRCLDFCKTNGSLSIVCSQYWLFLQSYTDLRKKILSKSKINLITRLGPRAFETISGEVVNVALFTITKADNCNAKDDVFFGLDVSAFKNPSKKSLHLTKEYPIRTLQKHQFANPEYRIIFGNYDVETSKFGNYVTVLQGSSTGDDFKYVRCFWEFSKTKRWMFFQTAPDEGLFSGRNHVWDWPNDDCELSKFSGARVQGLDALGKPGFIISGSQRITHSFYDGLYYSKVLASCRPKENRDLPAIFAYLESGEFERQIRIIDQKNLVTPGNFSKIPFDIDHWSKISKEEFPNSLPKPHSIDPTQWIFHGYPSKGDEALLVLVARLLGYCWPAELDTEMELSEEARDWVSKCNELLHYSDKDGIVCIPAVRGEMSAEQRLDTLLAAAFGDQWSSNKKSELLAQVDHAGKSMESWLRDKFFIQHCKLFHHRPFIWQVWDGLNDGFSALINYHKLDKKLLETLIYTYLGDWIIRQKDDQENNVDGAAEKLAAAENLKRKLELILEGEAPYDIFVRWKPIEKQPIGWDPDLNDGVRLNIRPFISIPDVKKKGAGILRDKPNVKWGKDRGKDVESSPWYQLFKGDRINDHHLTLDEKKNAKKHTLELK